MKTVTSVSGGRTSAFLAANYPTDHLLFALVRIEDERCRFPDEKIRREVEDRIQAPFIATAEDDTIIYTMLDLEQYLGQQINWVTGITYDQYIQQVSGGYPPNIEWRGCTEHLKLIPMALWTLVNIGEPVIAHIGFRANETHRANDTLAKVNEDGIIEIKIPVASKLTKRGWQKKNIDFLWQRPQFPLIEDGILKHDIAKYWGGKPVRFADYNNCVFCFHRHPLFLAKMFDKHPLKMQWAADKEGKGWWRKDVKYSEMKKWKVQRELDFGHMPACWSGFCEVA
jgi:hypothetical protein